MKTLLLFLILVYLLTFRQRLRQALPIDESPLCVSSFKWSRARQTVETQQTDVKCSGARR